MNFTSPDRGALKDTADTVDWTVIAPQEDDESELEGYDLDTLEDRVQRVKDRDGERTKLITDIDLRSGSSNEIASFRIDMSLLAKILYEHKRYSLAQGFSDAQMDVLRTVEFHKRVRVGVDEIMDDPYTNEYAESTIYKALNELQNKNFIDKVRPGVYRYTGP